jgi:hypothetical protein
MGEIVNLRRVRKQKARAVASAEAASNRAQSGGSRAEREMAAKLRNLNEGRLDAHRRVSVEGAPDDGRE